LLELLTRRDQAADAAFAALVERHGPMVLRVCRGILRDSHNAEDAFQATFLVLAHKAVSLQARDTLAPWLYTVAVRTATCARSAASRRRVHELRAAGRSSQAIFATDEDDSARVLHEEVNRLPDRYRNPVVLCYFEGLTHEEAAHRLGWPVGTVHTRLNAARERLRGRLTRRGLASAVGATVAALTNETRASVPEALAQVAIQASLRILAGRTAAGIASAAALKLGEGVLTTMTLIKVKSIATMILVLGAGAGLLVYEASGDGKGPPAKNQTASETAKNNPPRPQEPLGLLQTVPPPPATAKTDPGQPVTGGDVKTMLDASPEKTRSDHLSQVQALQEKVDRLSTELLRMRSSQGGSQTVSKRYVPFAGAQRSGARNAEPRSSQQVQSPKAKAIQKALEQSIAMSFPNSALEDVLKYIKSATSGPNSTGLQIYVDPAALEEVNKTMTSPVQIDLEGVPLKTTLYLILKQLNLCYEVRGGELLIITSNTRRGIWEVLPEEETPLKAMMQQAERGELEIDELQALARKLRAIQQVRAARAQLEGDWVEPKSGFGVEPKPSKQ
jgi:RNA polymerase sigma factor (sigma-70 family)